MTTDAGERHLLQRCRQGDREAFHQLVLRYQRRVYAIAYGMLKNSADADDVSQEVFLRLHRYLPEFTGQSSLYTWLYRITVNLCIDHHRSARRGAAFERDDDAIAAADSQTTSEAGLAGHVPHPSQDLDTRELGEQVMKALDSLSEQHRAILVLREVEGMSYEDLAQTLNINKGTVMSRLHHARLRFRSAIQGYLDSGEPGGSDGEEEK